MCGVVNQIANTNVFTMETNHRNVSKHIYKSRYIVTYIEQLVNYYSSLGQEIATLNFARPGNMKSVITQP